MNFGIQIRKLSVQLGVDYYALTDLYYGYVCDFYPCRDAADVKRIDILLDMRYKVSIKNKYGIEPFLNIYKEIVIYHLAYYYNNKENTQWKNDRTPYSSQMAFSVGTYINYDVFDHMNIFFAPTIKFNRSRFRSLASLKNKFNFFGTRIGTSYYF